MSRLFTFGCSFTLYNWPTWADLFGLEFSQAYNWGCPGIGNRGILERLFECDACMNFAPTDTVVIQWTSYLRHDYMRTNTNDKGKNISSWKTCGSIFNKNNQNIFDRNWINKFWEERVYFIHTLNAIVGAIGFLDGKGCKWAMTSMNDLCAVGNNIEDKTFSGEYQNSKNLPKFWDLDKNLDFYRTKIWEDNKDKWISPIINVIEECPEYNATFNFDKNSEGKWEEAHPSVMQHAIWLLSLKDYLQLDVNLTKEQAKMVNEITNFQTTAKNYKDFEEKINNTLWGKTIRVAGL
jgi:hypothetical protein